MVENNDEQKHIKKLARHDEILDELIERPRGMFAPIDRKYILGQREYSHKQARYKRRQEIQTRFKNTLTDFNLLPHLDDTLTKNIYNEYPDGVKLTQFNRHMASLLAFWLNHPEIDGDTNKLAKLVEQTIRHHEIMYREYSDYLDAKITGVTSVSVDIDIDYEPPLSKIEEKDKNELTNEEIGLLIRSGRVDPDELDEFVESSDPDFDVGDGVLT